MMEGVIEYLKKGLANNNVAIAKYKKSIADAGEDDDAITRMERNAVIMLETQNKETNKAIEILEKHRKE